MKAAFPYATNGNSNLIAAQKGYEVKTLNPTDSMQSMQSLHNASAGPVMTTTQSKISNNAGPIFIDMPSK
jgi:hypothetical protein